MSITEAAAVQCLARQRAVASKILFMVCVCVCVLDTDVRV